MSIFLPNPIFDHFRELSHRDDPKKWSKLGFGQEITEQAPIKVNFMHLIWSSASPRCRYKHLSVVPKSLQRHNLVKKHYRVLALVQTVAPAMVNKCVKFRQNSKNSLQSISF